MMLRSPTVIIAAIGLWGMNIYFFRLFKLDYVRILNHDLEKEKEALRLKEQGENNKRNVDDEGFSAGEQNLSNIPFGNRITWGKLLGLSILMFILIHLSEYIWVDSMGGSNIGAVFLFYSALAFAILFPLASTGWLRIGTMLVLQRSWELINPRCFCITQPPQGPRPIPFIDVFYADAMCSLSKVFFDWGWLLHLASHYPDPVPKSTHAILIPSFFAAIPYLCRARQCLIMHTVGRYTHNPKRYQHIMNAVKYASSIVPICFSAYQQTLDPLQAASMEPFLIGLLVINASYALWWDIAMDWGMMQDPTAVATHACAGGSLPEEMQKQTCGQTCMRPTLRFGMFASACIMFVDTVLRFSWLLRFREDLFPSKDVFVLATQILEIFRRALWNLLRVEWENIKHTKARSVKAAVSDTEDEEGQGFLLSPSSGSASS